MSFSTTVQVRFGDVDAAGIVFYPRYYEMLSIAVEDWCAGVLGVDFQTMHLKQNIGIPAVAISATFSIPSILGELLTIQVVPQALGNSSCRLHCDFSCAGEHRLQMAMTVVYTDQVMRRSLPWPAALRERIAAELPV